MKSKLDLLLSSCPQELQKIALLHLTTIMRKKRAELEVSAELIAYQNACWLALAGEKLDISRWANVVELNGEHGLGIAYDVDLLQYPSQDYGISVVILNGCMMFTKIVADQTNRLHDLTSGIASISIEVISETMQQAIDCSILSWDEIFLHLAEINISQKTVIDIWKAS